MDILFSKTPQGLETCSIDHKHLHSSYNPEREAERFVTGIQCDYSPDYVVITGPGLSYTAKYLRERFPAAKLICIHFCREFHKSDILWDKTILYEDPADSQSLVDTLFRTMGEEGTAASLFVSWPPSEQIFTQHYRNAWLQIKRALIQSTQILTTSTYFAKRWTKNSLKLFARLSTYFKLPETSLPVVVCASGPSLESSLPMIKQYRNRFFLLAVSSAAEPLLHRDIIPDMVLTTDGGYWAKLHLTHSFQKHREIPLAIPFEGAVFSKVMEQHPIIPLDYGDGPAASISKSLELETSCCLRNGTVSGTAALMALEITSGKVFFCGLDLGESAGYAHTQPNKLEQINSCSDNRLRPLETRIAPSSFESPQLNLYRSWFDSQDFDSRLYRLSDHYSFKYPLKTVRDVDWHFFDATSQVSAGESAVLSGKSFKCTLQGNERLERIVSCLNALEQKPETQRFAAPLKAVMARRCAGTEKFLAAQKALSESLREWRDESLRVLGTISFGKEKSL